MMFLIFDDIPKIKHKSTYLQKSRRIVLYDVTSTKYYALVVMTLPIKSVVGKQSGLSTFFGKSG